MNLDKHPILWEIYHAVQAIEACGASIELTNAVIKTGNISESAAKLVDEIATLKKQLAEAVEIIEWYGGDVAWGCGKPIWERPPIYKDGGEKARAFLLKVGETQKC